MDDVYYRVILHEGAFSVAHLQSFGEIDYDQDRFLTGSIENEQEAENVAALANLLLPDNLKTADGVRFLRLLARQEVTR